MQWLASCWSPKALCTTGIWPTQSRDRCEYNNLRGIRKLRAVEIEIVKTKRMLSEHAEPSVLHYNLTVNEIYPRLHEQTT
jgi:hypothetical protein